MQLYKKTASFLFPDDKKLLLFSIITATIATSSGYLALINLPFFTHRKLAYAFIAFIIIYILSNFSFGKFILQKISLLNKHKRIRLLILLIILSSLSVYLVDGLDFGKNLNWLPSHQVIITANGSKENLHNKYSVKLIGINYSDDESLSFSNLVLSGDWQRDDTGLSTSESEASIFWKSHPNNRMILFLEKSPEAGAVTISIDGNLEEIDLYDKEIGIKAIKKKFSPPAYIEGLNFFIKWLIFSALWGIIILVYANPSEVEDNDYTRMGLRFDVLIQKKVDTFKLYFNNNKTILGAVLLLVFIGLITYGRGIAASFVFGDEWERVYRSVNDSGACPMPNNLFLRPLTGCYFKFLDITLGTNVSLYRTTALLLTVLASIFLFFLLNTIFKGKVLFPLFVSLIFLVFPTTTVHSYFEVGYHKISAIFFFFALQKLYEADIHQDFKDYPKFSLIYFLSIIIYEANFGIAFLFAFFMCIRAITQSNRGSLLANSGLIGGLAIFSIGRLITQIENPGFFGHTVDRQMFSVVDLIGKTLSGFSLNQLTVWVDVLDEMVRSTSILSLFLIISIGLIIVFLIFYAILQKLGVSTIQYLMDQIPHNRREIIWLAVIGTLITLFGFVPMILGFEPVLEWRHSRINYWPSLGSSLVWVSITGILLSLIKNKKYALSVYFAVIMLFLGISIAKQVSVQNQLIIAWQSKKPVLEQLFDIALDFEPDTNVILIYTDTSPKVTKPFKGDFSVELNLLYYNQSASLNGYAFYEQINEVKTNSEGFIVNSDVVPFDRSVVFELSDGILYYANEFNGNNLCGDCIIHKQNPEQIFYRDLLLQ